MTMAIIFACMAVGLIVFAGYAVEPTEEVVIVAEETEYGTIYSKRIRKINRDK